MSVDKPEISIGVACLRVTGPGGQVLVRDHYSAITIATSVKKGKKTGNYKTPDTFEYFQITFDGKPDRELLGLLKAGSKVEFWTKNVVAGGFTQDEDDPWIHWAFPYTKWDKRGYLVTESGPERDVGAPDGFLVTKGAWWKTAEAPPVTGDGKP